MQCAYAKKTSITFPAEATKKLVDTEHSLSSVYNDTIARKWYEFILQYPYGDITYEESVKISNEMLEAYPYPVFSIQRSSASSDKNYYIYFGYSFDGQAAFFGDTSTFSSAKIIANGEEYQGTMFKSRSLASTEVFESLGCEVSFDEETYVTTISKGENVLELMPYILGMRKNKEDGEWIPLEICARYANEEGTELSVPVRAVAEELGISVEWDNDIKAVVLKSE